MVRRTCINVHSDRRNHGVTDLEIYDALPRHARDVLKHTRINWDLSSLPKTLINESTRSPGRFVRAIRKQDADPENWRRWMDKA